jgi:AsmA protein
MIPTMQTAKILGGVVGGLVVLVAAALLAVRLWVNPNDYKPALIAKVKSATGRELTLGGDLKLSVFPWIALESGPASLSNPPGFPAQPFVSFQHASVRVKLLPLLGKRLEVGHVDLAGLDLQLLRNAAGQGNWEGFGRGAAPPTPPSAGSPAAGGPAGALEGIDGVKISDARIGYQTLELTHVTLETGAFASRALVPVTLHLQADRGVAGETATLDLRFDFSADMAAERYDVHALNLTATLTRPGAPQGAGPVSLGFSAPAASLDLKAQTFAAGAFNAQLDGAELTGSVAGKTVVDAPSFTGHVALAPVAPRELMAKLGLAIPKTRDPKVLSAASFAGDFSYGGGMKLDPVTATLDDTHLKGWVHVAPSDAASFALTVDAIDLSRYLPPPEPAAPELNPPTPAAAVSAAAQAKPNAAAPPEVEGTLSIGSVKIAPLDLSQVAVTVASKDGVTRLHPLDAKINGGTYAGDITLDQRGATPKLSMDEHLTGVDVGQLVPADAKSLHVSGRGTIDLTATAQGAGADAMMRSLDGHFDADVANGALEGVDVGYQLDRAEALFKHTDFTGTDHKRTPFASFKMTAALANGVATTHDLTLLSPVFKVTGQGSANLAAKTLDFALLADTLKSAGNVALQIPVKVTGSMADPSVRPDVAALAQGVLKQKVQDLVKDKLKGLFSK